jgi:hypothetical protein
MPRRRTCVAEREVARSLTRRSTSAKMIFIS